LKLAIWWARDAAPRFRAARHECARARLDDEADWLQLFSQYETRLDRMLHRALHELQRLQARRAGADLPPPLVVDVDVRGLPSLQDRPEPLPAPSLRG
jgi:hypothetical protein